MIRQAMIVGALSGLLTGCLTTAHSPKKIALDKIKVAPRTGVQPKANKILFQASEYLKQVKTFKFQTEITRDVILYDGVHAQFSGVSNVTVQRPNKLKAIFNGDEKSRRSYFDGETLTMYSVTRNIYAQKKIPGTIDNAIDFVFETFGFSVPLADIVYADPYAILIENVDKGHFLGKHKVEGVVCNHLAFQQDLIDWQIWIEDGETPLVRKLVITYKKEEGHPEYEAEISNWVLNPSLSNDDFKFTPTAGVEKIEFLPLDKVYGTEDIIEIEKVEAE